MDNLTDGNFAMIYDDITQVVLDDVFLRLDGFADGLDLVMKIEAFNGAGSVKVKSALGLVEDCERRGMLRQGMGIVESSSGNLGIALAMICRQRGYRFICVADPNMAPNNRALIQVLGGQIDMVTTRDRNGGYLATRIERVRELVEQDRSLVWVNQYANRAAAEAHNRRTAASLFAALGDLDYLFVGAGTTGTIMGCAYHIREQGLATWLIAVDPEGSVTFGHPPGRRRLPGLGTSRRPELLCESLIDDVVIVPEIDSIVACREAVRRWGYFGGASTGTVLAGIRAYLPKMRLPARAAMISPDMGGAYLDTVYSDAWVASAYAGTVETPPHYGRMPLLAGAGYPRPPMTRPASDTTPGALPGSLSAHADHQH